MYIKDALGRDLSIVKFITDGSTTSSTGYFVYGTDRVARVTVGTTTPLAKILPDEATYFLYDHLGNTRVAFMVDGSTVPVPLIVNALDYYSYGKILREYDNGAGDRYLTTGHERDKETGSDYRGARYYDSDIARFLSLDPLAAKYPMFSAYSYVGGMPTIAVDPNGKDIVIIVNKTNAATANPGHTMIGVTEYDESGVATGKMMIYDLHPDHYPSDNRPVDGNIHYTVINADEVKQFAEGRGDEYILLGTTQEQDVKSMKFLTAIGKAVNDKKMKYKADTFNCTSLATETLEKIVYPDEELGQTTLEGPLFSSFTVDAPNQLYNDLMNKSEVKEKSTNKKFNEKAAQEFLDSQIK